MNFARAFAHGCLALLLALGAAGCAGPGGTPPGNLVFRDAQGEPVAYAELNLPPAAAQDGRFAGRWRLRSSTGGFPYRSTSARYGFGEYSATREGARFTFNLNPGVADNNLTFSGEWGDGRIAGSWQEATFTGPNPRGTFSLATTLPGAASAPTNTAPAAPVLAANSASGFTYALRRPADTISAQPEGDALVLLITSPSGIGAVTITNGAGAWPRPARVLLRFRHAPEQPFRYLEGLHAGAGGAPPAEISTRGELRPAPGWLEITLPAGLFPPSANTFEIAWVDAYR